VSVKQDAEIRRMLHLKSNAPISNAVREFVLSTKAQDMEAVLNQAGVDPQAFAQYTQLMLQGMQWGFEQYPQVPGPLGVVFGPPHSVVQVATPYGTGPFDISDDMMHVRYEEYRDLSYITIPWTQISHCQSIIEDDKRSGVERTEPFYAKSRAHLAPRSIKEKIFLGAVEEAYHAVQHQDPVLRERLEAEESVLALRVGNVDSYCALNHIDPHDIKPRELDVVPVLERAQQYYRSEMQRKIV